MRGPTLVLRPSSFDRQNSKKNPIFLSLSFLLSLSPFFFLSLLFASLPSLLLIFFFLFSFPFSMNSFCSSFYLLFLSFFVFLFSTNLFFSFLLFFFSLVLFFFVFLYSFFLFHFLLISPSFFAFLLSFGSLLTELIKEVSFFPFSTCHLCGPQFFFVFLLFPFIPLLHHPIMWLIVSHTFQVNHMTFAMCHSPRVPCGIPLIMSCVIRHPTPQKT